MNDVMRTRQEQEEALAGSAKELFQTMLDILAAVKEMPDEAPLALQHIDEVIAILLANQATMPERGRALVQPNIDHAYRVRSEIATIVKGLN